MNTALIWDVDGTLIDSYPVIVRCLREILSRGGFLFSEEEIHHRVITTSVREFLADLEQTRGLSFDMEAYLTLRRAEERHMKEIPHAGQLLRRLQARGIPNYIFTHRGASTEEMLKLTGLNGYFEDRLTACDGFPRKPSPEGLLHLMNKHRLDPACTYYVGDRRLDMECAARAGIQGILYLPPDSPALPTGLETHIVRDLEEIYPLIV